MRGWRHIFFSLLILLPALLTLGVTVILFVTKVPSLIHYEPIRIGREYRDVADDISDHGGEERRRQVGWRQVGKINGMPWGYADDGERTIVWLSSGDRKCLTRTVDTIKPFPYALVCYGGGSLLVLVFLWLSVFAVLCFHRYISARDDFLAAAAHDLTTPLVGMRRLIGKNDDEARRLNERMLLIVGNIVEFIRLGGHRKPPELERINFLDACREAYQLFRDDYRDLFDGTDVAITPSNSVFAVADKTMLMQILWNLFGNDLKYAAPYGSVAVRLMTRDGFAVAEFVDEGQGMTPSQMRRAFNRYYRARTVLESGKGGFGIGLCTARDFARAMGGDLAVRQNHPRGCVFSLQLPQADAQ